MILRINNAPWLGSQQAAFSPLDVAALEGWWKADAGITKDGGDLVSDWADQSGNGNDLVQATGTNQPLFVADVQNSLPIIRFDGVDNFMRFAAFASGDLTQPNTILIVVDQEAGASNVVYDGAGSSSKRNVFFSVSSSVHDIFSGVTLQDSTTITAGFEQVTNLFNGSSGTIRVDKTETAAGDTGTFPLEGLTAAANFNSTPGEFGAHDIGELIIYNADISDADRTLLETYLADRWGL